MSEFDYALNCLAFYERQIGMLQAVEDFDGLMRKLGILNVVDPSMTAINEILKAVVRLHREGKL